MLDACAQVGWELLQAYQQVETKPGYAFGGGKLRYCIKALSVYAAIVEDRYVLRNTASRSTRKTWLK